MSDRKRRLEIAKALKELLLSKGKTPSVKYQQTYEELREGSDLVSESSQLHSEFEFKKNLTQTFTPKFRHKHWFPCEMTTDWLKQISHAARTNQKHFLDLGSDRSSVWSFYSRRHFGGYQDTSGSSAKCLPFSQASFGRLCKLFTFLKNLLTT